MFTVDLMHSRIDGRVFEYMNYCEQSELLIYKGHTFFSAVSQKCSRSGLE